MRKFLCTSRVEEATCFFFEYMHDTVIDAMDEPSEKEKKRGGGRKRMV